jgi:hypothetical protein
MTAPARRAPRLHCRTVSPPPPPPFSRRSVLQANFAAARQALATLKGTDGGGGGGPTMQALGAVWRRLKEASSASPAPGAAGRELDVECLTDMLRQIL